MGMGLALAILLVTVLIVVVAVIGMFFFLLGWNVFVSPIFGIQEITLWQAFCAMLIIGIVGSAFKTNMSNKEV